jgi:hypothetical protein
MKILLTILCFMYCLSAQAQNSYITATGTVVLESGSVKTYSAPAFFVSGTFDVRFSVWRVTLAITSGVITASSPVKEEFTLVFTKAEIDAFTGAGTGDTAKCQNAVEKAVKSYLETLNPTSTVTIN